MYNYNLKQLVREVIKKIDTGGPATASVESGHIRLALHERGLGPGCHVGLDEPLSSEQVVEWYAGQLLSIVDASGWFAMNSLINGLDQFCPADE